MKPLTFEELKALSGGEPVWLVPQGPLPFQEKYYYKNEREDIDEAHEVALYDEHDNDDVIISDADYGTKWIAYKNKEQAEAKGEIVELPCLIEILYKVFRQDFKNYHLLHLNDEGILITDVFAEQDKAEAEHRLAELKGE